MIAATRSIRAAKPLPILLGTLLLGLRKRTPAPSAFSSMNSTPATSTPRGFGAQLSVSGFFLL